jgi:hypothetical protein
MDIMASWRILSNFNWAWSNSIHHELTVSFVPFLVTMGYFTSFFEDTASKQRGEWGISFYFPWGAYAADTSGSFQRCVCARNGRENDECSA